VLNFLFFGPFFESFFKNLPLEVCFQNLDPHLDAGVIGSELIRFGAKVFGAYMLGPRRRQRKRVGDMAASMAP
jgi:hypothetical protein